MRYKADLISCFNLTFLFVHGNQIDEVSKEFLQLLLNTSDAKVFDLTEALNASEKVYTSFLIYSEIH